MADDFLQQLGQRPFKTLTDVAIPGLEARRQRRTDFLQRQQQQQEDDKQFKNSMTVLNSLISAGASDESINDFLTRSIVPISDGVLEGFDFTTRAGEAGKFITKAYSDFEKLGDTPENRQNLMTVLQQGLGQFPKQAAAFTSQIKALQEQQQATAGVEALGPKATASELAQLQAGEDIGEVLGRRKGDRKIISGVTLGEETGTLQETEPGSGIFRVLEVAGVPARGKKRAGVEINLGKPASAGERTAIAETRASIDSLNNLKVLFDESFVGPAAGRAGAIKNIFGLNPDQQTALIAATAAFKNQVIKDITGAQMSEPEAKRIMKQIPSENDPPNVWLAKWEQSLRNLERLNERRKEVLKQSGVRAPESVLEEDLSNLSDDELLQRLQ